MENSTYNIIIGICGLLAAGVGFADDIVKNRYIQNLLKKKQFLFVKKASRNFFKIILYVLFGIIGIWATVEKDQHNQDESIQIQLANDSLVKKKDSLANISIQKNTNQIVSNITEGLAKYGLKFDSAKKQLDLLIKDSVNRKINQYSLARPILDFNNIILSKNTNDSLYFQLKIYCSQSTAYNVKLPVKYGCLSPDKNKVYYLGTQKDYLVTNQLSADNFRTININLKKLKGVDTYIFYLVGSYTDVPEIKINYPIEKFYYFDINTKKAYNPQLLSFDIILDYFNGKRQSNVDDLN